MNGIDIFNEIISHQIEGIMLHCDLANMFDFMGLHGFKRQHECRAMEEFAEMRGVNRYAINHLSIMPSSSNVGRAKEIIPTSWKGAKRSDVTESDRKSKVKELFGKWKDWETETKTLYQKKFKELVELGMIACANKVNELIMDIDKELKNLERDYILYSSVGWEMYFIATKQDELHAEYEKRTDDRFRIQFC